MSRRTKQLIVIFFMGSSYGVVYGLPFVQYMLYDPLLASIKATNAQLGILLAIYGVGNLIAPLGGYICDKFNHKTVYLSSVLGTAALCFFFAFNLSYEVAIFVWAGLAATSLFGFFPSHVKIIRLLGSKEEQGQVFGFTESAVGLGGVWINAALMYIFATQVDQVAGFKLVVIGYGVLAIIMAAILYFLIDGKAGLEDAKESGDTERASFADFINILKYRGTWHAGITVFVLYTLYVSMSYFTPYFTDVLGVSVTFAGSIAIIRIYVMRMVGAPLGGWLGDKMGSNNMAIMYCVGFGLAAVVMIMILPAGTSTTILIVLTLALSLFVYMGRGNQFAIQEEVKTPRKMAGAVAGIVCAIGYSPDLFQFVLFGHWLDVHKNEGYNYIFIYTIVVLAIGIANCLLTNSYKKSLQQGFKEQLQTGGAN